MQRGRIAFKKFNDLVYKDLFSDLHMHTSYTHAINSIEEMVDSAVSMNLDTMAITEHVNRDTIWYKGFLNDLNKEKYNAINKINLLSGIEARVINSDGDLDTSDYMMNNSNLIIGSVHSYPTNKGFISLQNILKMGQEEALEREFNLAKSILINSPADVLGHPFGVYSKLFGMFPYDLFEELCKISLGTKAVIEINTSYFPKEKTFFDILRRINPRVSIGSDAHKKEDIAKDFNIIRNEVKHG